MRKCFFFTFIPLLLGLLIALPALADADDAVDSGTAGAVSWVFYENGRLVFSGKGPVPNYEFDEDSYKTAPEWIQEHGDQIRSVVIGDDITAIGSAAFQNCRTLSEISIGSSVTSIGENAFLYCEDLKTVTIPKSVRTIEAGAFYSCTSLRDVKLAEGLAKIGGEAFCACDSLHEIAIPVSVTTIGRDAFLYDVITLSVAEQSAACRYARENDIPYKIVADSGASSLLPVIKLDNVIEAKDITKTVSSSPVKCNINASADGDASLSYSSDNASIKVNKTSGQVTIAENYIGGARITIIASETALFNKTTKTITVKSVPAKTSLVGVYNIKSGTAQIRWKKGKKNTGYQIQYASSPNFADSKTVTVKNAKTTVKNIGKLTNGTTYYFRLRTYKTVSGTDYCSGWSDAVSKKIAAKSYDTKVYSFIHKKAYKNGAKWGENHKPLISHYSCKGCCAYAADFFATVTGNKKNFGKKTFKNVKKIRTGDVIKFGQKQHWIAVLYRIGNKLVTAEGNWQGKVIVSDSTYSIKGGRILRKGKKFRPLNTGYHSR